MKETQTRREFLQSVGLAAVRLAGVATINGLAIGIRGLEAYQKQANQATEATKQPESGSQKEDSAGQANQATEATKQPESGNQLVVKDFAKDIMYAGQRITANNPVVNLAEMATGWFFGDALGGFLLRNQTKAINRVAGAAGFGGGKLVDIISTVMAASRFNDPRFKEYGLDAYVSEANIFVSANPSRRELIILGLWQAPLVALSGFYHPSLGRGYALASPFIAKNNLEIATLIDVSLKLGDIVKQDIKDQKDVGFIQTYLSEIEQINPIAKAPPRG